MSDSDPYCASKPQLFNTHTSVQGHCNYDQAYSMYQAHMHYSFCVVGAYVTRHSYCWETSMGLSGL